MSDRRHYERGGTKQSPTTSSAPGRRSKDGGMCCLPDTPIGTNRGGDHHSGLADESHLATWREIICHSRSLVWTPSCDPHHAVFLQNGPVTPLSSLVGDLKMRFPAVLEPAQMRCSARGASLFVFSASLSASSIVIPSRPIHSE